MNYKKKSLLNRTYKQFMETGLNSTGLTSLDKIVEKNVTGFGSAIDEKIYGVKALKKLLQNQKKQSKGVRLQWKIKPVSRQITADNNSAVYADDIFLTLHAGSEIIKMYLRFSVVLNYINDQWKVVHWHGSKPEQVQSEEDTYGIDSLKQKNAELEKLVEEKTVDLSTKNRELQIETSLEKVRAVAMGMTQRDDMLNICKTISQQMTILGVKEIRNVQTAIIYKEKGTYINYEFYTRYGKTCITPTNYTEYKAHNKWALQMLGGMEKLVNIHLEKQELKKWIAYQKTTNVFIDKYLDTAASLDYYWYSLGSVALGISTYEPFSEDEMNLFQLFRNVFELAYKRYVDIATAAAQSREAHIEAALEKVRSSSLAMHRSDELQGVVNTVIERLKELNIILDTTNILIFNDKEKRIEFWTGSNSTGTQLYTSWKVPYADFLYYKQIRQARENKQEIFAGNYSFEEKNKMYHYLFTQTDFRHLNPERKKFILKSPGATIVSGIENDIAIQIISYSRKAFTSDEIEIVKRFAKVFNQAYTRFLDLQKAEMQTREAQIQLALERVRAKSLAMHHSSELQEVANITAQQLHGIGMDINGGVFICLNKEVGNELTIWASGGMADYIQKANVPFLNKPIYTRLRNAIKKGNNFLIELYSKKEKQELFTHLFQYEPWRILPQKRKKELLSREGGFARSVVISRNTSISITNHNGKAFTDKENGILKRFGKVFEQSYTRFLDLQKAEAQAREAQIEASLERVRSRTMAMHQTSELQEVIHTVHNELLHLNISIDGGSFVVINKDVKSFLCCWGSGGTANTSSEILVPDFNMPFCTNLIHGIKKGPGFFTEEFSQKEKKKYFTKLFKQKPWSDISASEKKGTLTSPGGYTRSVAVSKHTSIFIINHQGRKFTDAENDILKRFARVFEQTYTRFLDLQKAEAQARESQIQLALERVRARTMAMQRSDELTDVAALLFKQVSDLGIKTWTTGFNVWSDNNNFYTDYITNPQGGFVEPYTVDASSFHVFAEMSDAKKRGDDFYIHYGERELLAETYRHLSKFGEKQFKAIQDLGFQFPEKQYEHVVFGSKASLLFITYEPVPEAHDIFKRFGKVFEQTYTRFLDLQKAEAQAREAQIEAALERVRAKAMAMHSSEDVTSATVIMFAELEKLGIKNFRCGINHIKTDRTQEVWSVTNSAEGKTIQSVGSFDIDDHPFWKKMYEAWMEKKEFLYDLLTGNEKEKYVRILNATPNYLSRPIMDFPDVHFSVYFFGEGTVWAMTLQPPSEEDKQIMKRFASVFSLTFRRYHDLLKAEAQAKEAKIEAALERVRSKAMAMHSSQDLADTIGVFYKELQLFSFTPLRCGVGLLNKENKEGEIFTWNTTKQGESLELVGKIKMDGHPVLKKVYSNWLTQTEYHPVLRGNEIKEYYKTIRPMMAFPDYHNDTVQYGYFFFFNEGGVYAWTENEMKEDELQIYRRFSSVLSLTYKRYKDIQQAEANTKEAIKQAALDRIRADIASMRTVDDLDRITPLIWNELTIIGIPFIRCGVFIMDEKQELIHTFLSTPDGKAIAAIHIPYDTPGKIKMIPENWRKKITYTDHWNDPDFIDFANALLQQHAIESADQYLSGVPHGGFYLHFVPFLQGMMYVGNSTELSDDEINLIQSVADAFSTAYARYEDFNKLEAAKKQVDSALNELQSTQKQLIQSEKMASLGELTAGIAHEIQNPLNFVNNFSDVNNELIDELNAERLKPNTERNEQIENDILNDIKQNLEKINHHGQRASAIVKGMLQHSRSGTGQKELTDINALCDEYLRLAYHGLRAKDKTFHAKYETDFDTTLEKINVTPQDIGRVILNLINNAFYAVSEKKKQAVAGYEPMVTVATKNLGNNVEVRVKDNGAGMPQKVLDKIFQPFFTTKPTGQGTGLGLSLSYDIITKGHGGELRVETKQDEGSEFIIQLPVVRITD